MGLVFDLIAYQAVGSGQDLVLRECRGCQRYLRGDLWPGPGNIVVSSG